MRMELRQLEYFVAVAEEANFTRAARRVHISQSGVSAQIRQLESDLGATLIDRSGRNATVTPAGAAALEQAKAVLASVTAIRRSVDDVTGLMRGRITIGMVTACMITPLFDALAAFHGAHPGVEIALSEDNSDRLIEGVRSGAIDVALVGVAGSATRGAGLDHHHQRAAGCGGARRPPVGPIAAAPDPRGGVRPPDRLPAGRGPESERFSTTPARRPAFTRTSRCRPPRRARSRIWPLEDSVWPS